MMTVIRRSDSSGGERIIMTACPYCDTELSDGARHTSFNGHWRYCPYNPEQEDYERAVGIDAETLAAHYRDTLAIGETVTGKVTDIVDMFDASGIGLGNVLADLRDNPHKADREGVSVTEANPDHYGTIKWHITHTGSGEVDAETEVETATSAQPTVTDGGEPQCQ